jgi:hypothetical protein
MLPAAVALELGLAAASAGSPPCPDNTALDVRTFGAKGDGVTDDGAAVEQAFAAAAAAAAAASAGGSSVTIRLPAPGVYVLDRQLVLNASNTLLSIEGTLRWRWAKNLSFTSRYMWWPMHHVYEYINELIAPAAPDPEGLPGAGRLQLGSETATRTCHRAACGLPAAAALPAAGALSGSPVCSGLLQRLLPCSCSGPDRALFSPVALGGAGGAARGIGREHKRIYTTKRRLHSP